MRATTHALMAFVCLLVGVSTAFSQNISDSTAPQVQSGAFSTSAVDTTAGAQNVTVRLQITDDLSGVNYAYVSLRTQNSSQPNNTNFVSCYVGQLESGSRQDGTFVGTCQFPQYSQSGTWYVSQIYAYDAVGNYRGYYNNDNPLPVFRSTVTVTAPDRPASRVQLAEPPSIAPGSIDVSDAAHSVTLTLHVTSQSPFSYGYIYLYDPTAAQSVGAYLSSSYRISGTSNDGVYQVTATIPRYSRTGTWRLQYLDLYDTDNNRTNYYWFPGSTVVYFNGVSQPNPVATATFDVASTQSDTTGASLVYFSVAPSSIDVSTSSAYVSYTLAATDDLAGFSYAFFAFVSPNGQQYRSGYANSSTSTGTIYFPQFSEAGNWRLSYIDLYDVNNNRRFLDANAVAALGFPSNIQISSGLTVSDVSVRTGNLATLSAKLTYHGAPSAGQTIQFSVKGHSVGSALTDANGIATLTDVSVDGIAVGTYPNAVTASFGGDGTQAPTSGAATLVVTNKLDQTITFDALGDRLLADSPVTISATASSGLPVSFAALGSCTVSGSSVTLTGAGSCQIVTTQIGDATYNAAPSVSRSFTITAKQDQTISFAAIADKRYGDADFTAPASASSGLTVSLLASGQCSVSNTTVTIHGAGTCSITASQPGNSSYNAATPVSRSFEILPASLAITAADQKKVYGAAMPAFSATYQGFVNGDNVGSLSGSLVFDTVATAASHVGTYDITPSGLSSANYAISFAAGKLSVTPAPLTVAAVDQTKVYGAALPALTVSISGWVNGDAAASLTKLPTVTTVATAASHVGTYAITAAGAEATDYAISYVPGTLTVTPAPLTIAALNQTKVYGSALPSLTVSYSGWVNGDSPASLTKLAAATTTATAASHVGTYAITASGAESADYAISYVSGTLTVTVAPLAITALDQTKIYGAELPALTVTYDGWVNGDTAASLTKPPAVTTTATMSSGVGTYPITASGAEARDYAITYVPGVLTITYNTCLLYDPSRMVQSGATIPIKLQLCSSSGANASASSTVVTAVEVALVSTDTSGIVADSGNANPDGNFRFDPALGGYIFNLSTKGLGRGTYYLRFTVSGDPAPHRTQFQVR